VISGIALPDLSTDPVGTNRTYAVVLGAMACAFFLRVLGQALVAMGWTGFLPPMGEWYSGLIPYPPLLMIQLVILALQAAISRDIWKDAGIFAAERPALGRNLRWFSYVYSAVMLVRYVVTMVIYPQRRWLSGTIPIFFHWVLAAYLFTLGRYYCRPRDAQTVP
jgi:hypothetical protein